MAFVILLAALLFASSAGAAPPEFLARISAGDGEPGSGAAEVDAPRGIVANPANGHVYVIDDNNARINEYTAWGLFVKSWGWDVAPEGAPGDTSSDELETCGPPEPEESPSAGLCQKGDNGSGNGQLSWPVGLTLDGAGNVYVFDRIDLRIQKFSPAGEFLLMFGGGVNQTTGGDVCTKADTEAGDVCGAGSSGEAPSHFAGPFSDNISYSFKTGAIVVGDKDRIQIFETDGTYQEEISFEGPLAAFAEETVNALDVDKEGNIYFALEGEEDIYKVSAAGVPLAPGQPGASEFDVKWPLGGVAVDVEGNVYAVDAEPTPKVVPEVAVIKFGAAGNRLMPTKAEEEAGEFFPYVPFQGPALTAIATNICEGSAKPGNLYISAVRPGAVSYVDAYGPGPVGCELPPKRPPVITAQFATAVGREDATVRARINPKFWTDTTYYVEFGTSQCSEGGCPNQVPLSPLTLTDKSVNKALLSSAIVLEGLSPSTTYHFRFVAKNSGGGPVYGIDPDAEGPNEADQSHGLESSFRTHAAKGLGDTCANAAVRLGPSAELPDCRAYEMVSPLDKDGGDVALWRGRGGFSPYLIEVHQSSDSGERFTYSAWSSFHEPEATPFTSQYLATRNPEAGWGSEAISPPRTELPVSAERAFEKDFQLFSADLCSAWVRHYSVSTLASEAIEGYPNLYRRDNCAAPPSYTALTTEKPADRDAADYTQLRVFDASEDGSHAIFMANDGLVPGVPLLDKFDPLLYEHVPGGLRFVCYLPSGKASLRACSAGTAANFGTESSARNAISADGSRIFWTAHDGTASLHGSPGPIYVRIEGEETFRVSEVVAPQPAWYWTAAGDGSKAIFEFDSGPFEDKLYEFDVDSKTPKLIAGGVEGPLGASEDASRIYFASNQDLDGAGPGAAGGHNLYLYQADPEGGAGTFTFIMALASSDIGGTSDAPRAIEEMPAQRSAVVTPDGLHATFTSVVSPTPSGYDNVDAASGEPDQEVYRYDAASGELHCVSCNSTGARPSGAELDAAIWAAARIQGWEVPGRAPRALTDDGTRVFFESFEALVPRDTNGTWDVYQWEEPGKGTCTNARETFSAVTGGCVDLISSGQSPVKSTFLDADPSGDNIFFSTQSSLVGLDYDLNDVYVARVGGGFPEPPPPPDCEGEACQTPAPPPPTLTPASESFRPTLKPQARRCPKGKRRLVRKGKVRCVKKRRAHNKRKGGRR